MNFKMHTSMKRAAFYLFLVLVFSLSACRPAPPPAPTASPTLPAIVLPSGTPIPTPTPPVNAPLPGQPPGPIYLPIVEYENPNLVAPGTGSGEALTETPIPTLAPTLTPAPTNTPRPTLFPTPVRRRAAESDVRFAVIGDYGVDRESQAAVADRIEEWDPEFILTVGDNNYPTGAADTIDQNIGKYYRAYIYPYRGQYGSGASTNRFFPTLGNHDWITDGGNPYYDYFTLPGNERYYQFTWGPAQFFALDSDVHEPDGVYVEQTQARWLQEELVASTACWRFVYFHHPAYSSGYDGDSRWMQWPYRLWGADAVLGGHDHHYERLFIDDMLYFVVGASGDHLYEVRAPRGGSEFIDDEDFGFMAVTADETSVVYEYYNSAGGLVERYEQIGGCQ